MGAGRRDDAGRRRTHSPLIRWGLRFDRAEHAELVSFIFDKACSRRKIYSPGVVVVFAFVCPEIAFGGLVVASGPPFFNFAALWESGGDF